MVVKFSIDDESYTVSISPEFKGLYRVSAMIHYKCIKPFIISGHKFIGDGFLFDKEPDHYQIFTIEKGWVRVPREIGDKVLHHPIVRFSKLKNFRVNKKFLSSAAIVVLSAAIGFTYGKTK
jgi:hypothetical protein